jgi:hypothetical protein
MSDFDGCHLSCRKAGKHTYTWTRCELASPPPPTVSMTHITTEDDGSSHIKFDTYTVEGLADLIEPALKNVKVTFGPNSIALLEKGNTLRLSGGELRALALEAAHAIIHRKDSL